MESFTIGMSARLEGSIEFDAATYPPEFKVKGMFCSRFAEALGPEWEAIAKTLKSAPRLGRYLAFQDYPQVDYIRLCLAVAERKFARFSLREGVRRLARDDLAMFGSSLIGKAVLALAGDARSTLLRLPDAYARVTTGSDLTAVELDPSTVRIEFRVYHGLVEYTIGQLEGVVLHFGGAPALTIRKLGPNHISFDVTH